MMHESGVKSQKGNSVPLRLVIAGSTGKTGKEVKNLALVEATTWNVVGEITRTVNFDFTKTKIDVVVDFSSVESFSRILNACVEAHVPIVCGTTGISVSQKNELSTASARIPVFYAPNMSLGVAVLRKMLMGLSVLSDYDFHLHEIHHKHKQDRPSGTALWLQEALHSALGRTVEITVERGGGVFGIHEVRAHGPEETLSISHNALNRVVFARGALHAAQWLVGRSPGLYSMDDMLK